MKISITAVTKNRLFSKSLVRIANRIKSLKTIAEDIDTSNEKFDTLQIVLGDHNIDHIEAIGTQKGDRLFQVIVGIPTNLSLKADSDLELVEEIRRRLRIAINSCSLESSKKEQVLGKLDLLAQS